MRSFLLAVALLGCAGPKQAGHDPALAQRLGADERGMRKYVIAFLKAGPNRDQSEEEAGRLMKAHLDNIGRLAAEGKLVLAGPFMDDGALRGIYIFDVETLEEAAALTATDPAIKAGRLEMELHPWYGSAALRALDAIHQRIRKPVSKD
jgi:uncharacterized protein